MYPVKTTVTHIGGLGNAEAVLNLASKLDPAVRAVMESQQQRDQAAQENAKKNLEDMEKGIKKEAIKTAAAQASITIALNFIPVVGQVLSLVAGQVLGSHAKRYGEKLKAYGEERMGYLQNYIAKRQEELDNAISKAYQTAYKMAIPLALSFQPLKFTENVAEEVLNKETYGGSLDGIRSALKTITGESVYEEGKEKIDSMVSDGIKKIDNEVNPIIAKVKQPGFVALLGKTIAVETRANPQFIALARQIGAPLPSKYMGDAPTGPAMSGSTPIASQQAGVLQSGNGMGTKLPSTQASTLPSTGDSPTFFSPTESIDDALKTGTRLRTAGMIAAAAVGAFLLFK